MSGTASCQDDVDLVSLGDEGDDDEAEDDEVNVSGADWSWHGSSSGTSSS